MHGERNFFSTMFSRSKKPLGSLRRGGPTAGLGLLLVAGALAGCVGGPAVEPSALDTPLTAWENGLAEHYETPGHVTFQSASDRAHPTGANPVAAAAFDAHIEAFLEAYDIPGATAAIMHDGRVLHEQAYRFKNEAGTQPTTTDTLFRVASVSKPITHAVALLMVEEGLMELNDPVFCLPPEPRPDCLLDIPVHPDRPVRDPRIENVTLEHLLAHTGGWGRSTDWVYRAPGPNHMAETFGIASPPPTWRVAQYVLGEDLSDPPGEVFWYCNLCYMMTGLIIESVTGATLQAVYDAYLFRPLDVEGDIELGRTRIEERNPRETGYQCNGMAPSVWDEDEEVCAPDGNIAIEMTSAAGGLIATPAAIAAVHGAYQDGLRPQGFYANGQDINDPYLDSWGHSGAMDGTTSISGVVRDKPGVIGEFRFVVILNSSTPVSSSACYGASASLIGGVTLGCALSYLRQTAAHFALAQSALDVH